MKRQTAFRQQGLTLLELLVAFVIMAMALGMLYKASGSSARNIGETASYQRAVFLAESLLASRDVVPAEGWNETGQSAGFSWQVRTQPYATPASQSNRAAPLLHALDISVAWKERDRARQIELHTLRPQSSFSALTQGRP